MKLFMYLICVASLALGQEKFATVTHGPIDEQSCIVKSPTYDDVFWVTNDSGDKPTIFALNGQGEIIIPDYLQKRYAGSKSSEYPGLKIKGAVLIDWESLTLLGDTLVITDMGNNGNARRDLGIYLLPEPNPHATDVARPLVYYPVHYEDQHAYPPEDWAYDCEAVFTYNHTLYFLTKHRSDRHISKPSPATKLYRMDTRYTDRSNALKLIGRADNLGGWVTAADMAPDGSGVVFLAQNFISTMIWFYPTPKSGDNFLASQPRAYNLLKADQAEGVCFKDTRTLIITNEQRDWFQVSLSEFK